MWRLNVIHFQNVSSAWCIQIHELKFCPSSFTDVCNYLSLSITMNSMTFPRFPIWHEVSLSQRRVQPDTDHEPQGARGRRVTDDQGCIPLAASHSISGLLSSTLLCPCHMYAKQWDGEVGCPVCKKASITFMAWMHRNEETQCGGEWALVFEWRQEWGASFHKHSAD